jgi:hypothetical protein
VDSPTAIPNIHRRIFATNTGSTSNASISLHNGLGEESFCTGGRLWERETLVVKEYEALGEVRWKPKDWFLGVPELLGWSNSSSVANPGDEMEKLELLIVVAKLVLELVADGSDK